MKKEYDFAKGERGRFFNGEGDFSLPIYLEPEIAEFVKRLAEKNNSEPSSVVNQLLRKDKELIEF